MQIWIKISLLMGFIVSLVACDNNSAGSRTDSPSIPNYSIDKILDMSKNERQELERRCLGISHQTCSNLSSGSFRERKESRLKICNYKASLENDNEKRTREQKKCDELF